jgi:hypothetical protein
MVGAGRWRATRQQICPEHALVDDALARTFGVESILPTQFACGRGASPGPMALLAAVLTSALEDAGMPFRAAPPRNSTAYARQVARRDHRRCTIALAWLLGELDGTVDVPREWVCAALGLDAEALADAVRLTYRAASRSRPLYRWCRRSH